MKKKYLYLSFVLLLMDTSLKVIFTELYEYGSDFIWSTEVKNGSKFDSLGILSEMCLLLSYWKVWLFVSGLQNPL